MTERKKLNFDLIEKTQIKMHRSKQRLQKDLIKVLEKTEIDRPLVIQEKANLIINEDKSHLLISNEKS